MSDLDNRPADYVAQLEQEVSDLTKALTGLTCGGSEFFLRKGERYVADTRACVEYVNRVRRSQHEALVREIVARKAAEASVKALSTPPADHVLNTEGG